MAKPTKNAPIICTIVTIIALIGVIVGLYYNITLIAILGLLPAVIYEAYRTEGKSTKTSSYILLGVLIAEIILILFNINFNLAEYLDSTQEYIGGYLVPLGDIQTLGPTLMAVLSVILFVRTRGVYTRWLAAVIFFTSFVIIYSINPLIFNDLIKNAVQQGIRRF
ncbi:hypothetical protein GX888_00075 [Candidatus Dojkabacteria bacterium]|uniref:Uncharacterized protein n=1 Tax=Candidatus Dojkabacteria bacterium TaxID=2099670 RepID=A0A847VC58_9BACT|nr:hypothetical protein [Candidatus Dojkabacteria bacterium]